jgi:hypothetical protein
MEHLEKSKCVRCGKPNKNGGKGGRCTACLKKLKTAKKTPGSAQRAQTKADDALRRQDGDNGTASHKSSGRGTRKSIVRQIQSAEKKTGQKLSPDRRDNSKGYAAYNVRAVPEKLNVGRHKVDSKKLANWHKRLKKNDDVTFEEFREMMLSKAYDGGDDSLIKELEDLRTEELLNLLSTGDTV